MDIQLFATDEELQDFPESKTDSSTVQDKTPSPKSINLMASDLPRSHSDLPKISSRLPERKSKRKSRRDHRRKSRSNTRSKNCIVGRLAAQTNDQLDTKQEIQWVIRPTHETYLDQLVGRPVGPPPSEAALPGQPVLSSPETAPPVARQYSISPWSVSPYSVSPWSARLSSSTVVVPSSPARLERARSNPLTPGTPVRPPRYPDWPEPIKLNYKKYRNAQSTGWHSCG